MNKVKGFLKLMRIRHWIKNLLIFVPVFFSGNFMNKEIIVLCAAAFACFCFASSFIYIINDLKDAEKDRTHPTKKSRPIASGAVSKTEAAVIGALMLVLCALCIILFKFNTSSIVIVSVYIAVNIFYSLAGKNIPVLDIVILSSGYVLRLLFGGTVTDTKVSAWLFLTTLCFSFYFGFGKRLGEYSKQAENSVLSDTRSVLKKYSGGFLNNYSMITQGLGLCFYALWTIEKNDVFAYTVPLVLVICILYGYTAERKTDGDPITTLFSSKPLMILSAVYVVVICALMYFI